MAVLEERIRIRREVGEVFAFAADPTNVPRWQPAVVSMRQTSAGPFRTGSRIEQTRRLAGRTFDIVVECTAFDPNERLVLEMVTGPMRGRLETLFDAEDGSTIVRLRAEVSLWGPLRFAERVLDIAARRELVDDLVRLRGLLERDGRISP